MRRKKDEVIGHLLHRASHDMRQILDAKLSVYGITSQQSRILAFLADHGEKAYQKDIEAILHIRRSSVSSVLQNLEKQGHIYRENDVNNRRNKMVILTDRGRELNLQIFDKIDDVEDDISNFLTTEERKDLVDIMHKLIGYLEEKK